MAVRTHSKTARAARDACVGPIPVNAVVDGTAWNTSVWRDRKTNGALLAVPARVPREKGHGDSITVEFTFECEDDA